MKKNLPVTDVEREYGGTANILSTTDLKGAISYFNDDFLDICGFSPDELLHKNHNVVRHPDMPPEAFEDLWTTLKDGKSWMGIVKNRCKNGDHYWVDAYVTPIRNKGKTIEYQSVRRKPEREHVQRAEKAYKQLLEGKVPHEIRPAKLGLAHKILLAINASLFVGVSLAFVLFDIGAATAITMFLASASLASAASFFALRPLTQAITAARNITDNPIARHIYTGRNDDIGAILLAFKMLGSETGGIVGRISDDANRLSESAAELMSTITAANENVQRQFLETDQVATAINEMAASIREVSSNAQRTADAAESAMTEASEGHEVMAATSASISNLAGEIERASGVIAKVESSSQEINTILDVIKNVSEQTNLLALNAAIEAARAGEHGRGFAVVADEVRTLAARTSESTNRIQEMIESLQKGAREAVAVMQASRSQAMGSVDQATSAATSIGSITAAVEKIKDMSFIIASAVEQQSVVSEEINRSIASIRGSSEQTMEASHSTSEACGTMTRLANGLSDLANEFWEKRIHR
ncbi:MAG: PAS domain-containing protein [Gammaproteobacteria bacterium]|nr:PAS domain-containing protein [Gammaproteobacteria bacterium]